MRGTQAVIGLLTSCIGKLLYAELVRCDFQCMARCRKGNLETIVPSNAPSSNECHNLCVTTWARVQDEHAYLCFKGSKGGLHFSSLHAVGGLLHCSRLAVAALPGQQVHHTPLVQQLLAAVRLSRPPAAHCILERFHLGCMLLRLLAHLRMHPPTNAVA